MNADVRELCGVSAATANRILASFVEVCKLRKYREGGHWAYKFSKSHIYGFHCIIRRFIGGNINANRSRNASISCFGRCRLLCQAIRRISTILIYFGKNLKLVKFSKTIWYNVPFVHRCKTLSKAKNMKKLWPLLILRGNLRSTSLNKQLLTIIQIVFWGLSEVIMH